MIFYFCLDFFPNKYLEIVMSILNFVRTCVPKIVYEVYVTYYFSLGQSKKVILFFAEESEKVVK